MTITKLSTLISSILLTSTAFGATFTVTSTADPAIVNPANCTAPSASCTLRDALAAADQDPLHDHVQFDVHDTIHITRGLQALHPVTIDGGGDTQVRVHQGYSIAILPDFFGDREDVPVVQPTYFSQRGYARPMLMLLGDGSVVTNLVLDGSITPQPEHLGIARLDWESDGATDFLLFTLDTDDDGAGDAWAIGGGILVNFDPSAPGSAEISNSEMKYMNDTALLVAFSDGAVVSNNEIKAGSMDPEFFEFYNPDGLYLPFASNIQVTGNEVSGMRSGMEVNNGVNAIISGNGINDNRTVGIAVLNVSGGAMTGNMVAGHAQYGAAVAGGLFNIADNEFSGNGSAFDVEGGLLVIYGGGHTITGNEASGNSGFGIAIDRSQYNVVAENEFVDNIGSGIVIINSPDVPPELQPEPFSVGNQFLGNQVSGSFTGIVAGFAAPYPQGNYYQGNELNGNVTDVLDNDPVCNDGWVDNEFNSAAAASAGCIH